ncbi:MAG: glycosyltransferase family 2 protein, partial [Candidatus Levybacteria bacterium]|nr:glycosyltransferase family 2 protein [Candidatus Levybacteria bacterium]
MNKLTVSIVNYNAGEYLIKCLESLRSLKNELSMDIVVVDNASIDSSINVAKKKFPEFKYIINKKNLGFGKAHNLAIKNAKTPYILVLNPDCRMGKGVIPYLYEFMESNKDVGVCSCRVEKEDGSLDKASHRGFPTPWASFLYFFLKNDRLYHLTDRNMSAPHEVDSVVGAFMFLRKKTLDETGLFDEDYFLYGEDIDLCYRIKEKSYKVMYVPEVKIIHAKGVSSGIKKHSQEKSIASKHSKFVSIGFFYSTM